MRFDLQTECTTAYLRTEVPFTFDDEVPEAINSPTVLLTLLEKPDQLLTGMPFPYSSRNRRVDAYIRQNSNTGIILLEFNKVLINLNYTRSTRTSIKRYMINKK